MAPEQFVDPNEQEMRRLLPMWDRKPEAESAFVAGAAAMG